MFFFFSFIVCFTLRFEFSQSFHVQFKTMSIDFKIHSSKKLISHHVSSFRNHYTFSSKQCQSILKFIRQKNWSMKFRFENTIDNVALTIEYMNETIRKIWTNWVAKNSHDLRRISRDREKLFLISKIFERFRKLSRLRQLQKLQRFLVIRKNFSVIAKNSSDIENFRKFSKIFENCRNCNNCKNCKDFS